MTKETLMDRTIRLMFSNRILILVLFTVLTAFTGYNALKLRVDEIGRAHV